MIKLNLACGTDIKYPPWVNLDVVTQWPSAARECDILWDARKDPIPFPDNSTDEIYAGYLLMHLPPRYHAPVLAEIARVLRPDGILRVGEVDMARVMPLWLSDPTYQSISRLIWGEQASSGEDASLFEQYDKHCHGFTLASLSIRLRSSGFIGITRVSIHVKEVWYELTVECRKHPGWNPRMTWPVLERMEKGVGDRVDFQLFHAIGKIVNIGCSDDPVGFGPETTHVDLDVYDIPNFVQSDCTRMPFASKQFDTAVLGDILEHVLDPEVAVREAARVARRVVITLPEELRLPSVGQHISLGIKSKADEIREVYPEIDKTLSDDETIDQHKKTLEKFVRSTAPNTKVPHDGHINRFDEAWVNRLIQASGMRVIVRETRVGGFDANGVYQWQGWLLVLER